MTSEHIIVRREDLIRSNLWRLFPCINVDVTKDIPRDYPGPMGVPITFMDKFCETQFELLGMTHKGVVHGKNKYARLIIRHLHPDLPDDVDLTDWFERLGFDLEAVPV